MGKYDRYGSDIKRALKQGDVLYAIKIYAQRTGCGLKLARDYIDSIQDRYLPKHMK
jgi:ribosomal protein L7/L12